MLRHGSASRLAVAARASAEGNAAVSRDSPARMTMPKVKCTSGIGLAGIRAGLEQPAGLGVNHDGALPDAACCWLQTSSGELDLGTLAFGSTVTGGCSQEAPAEAAGGSQEDPGWLGQLLGVEGSQQVGARFGDAGTDDACTF